MRYQGSLTIPAGTLQVSPASVTIPLTYGRIDEVAVLFPPGPAGLVRCAVLYHEKQIFPTSPDESFIGDDHWIVFPERFPVYDEPFEIRLVGWSPSAAMSHTIYVEFTVESEAKAVVAYSGSVALPSSVLRTKR